MENTFSIIKPDATKRNLTGAINKMIEDNGLKIIAQKRIHLTQEKAKNFYSIHKDKVFFNDLIEYMTSEPVVLQVNNAVEKYRKIMGATNPKDANEGTIRKNFAIDVQSNSVHGSDSLANAEIEIKFFFNENEIFE